MQEELRQTTDNAEVIIVDDKTGRKLAFSNGGIDGEFEIIVTDKKPVPALFQPVGKLELGSYTIKGNYAGKDYREIKLDGAYTVYGNPEDGNVMIVKKDGDK
ncbi:hypothetical protein H5S09_09740 [Limosilactobacillus sp. STM2_1]|uniref:Uncharacterized protein n=1 Tax=Limosilactobacillus rudii TaxID=2759755 RepID=A0A7W3UN86_9LACO|nr:hypothetical protein [Limosilactobacillus rudii]MBB1078909.1 hypothetical protein [Limosilactobacillus rudii]MBB1098215.1 hypothetical protein [Limosilactobacillus rudii]MCD7135670.1 hypothetical protein [Limosilactobacillus rudii]